MLRPFQYQQSGPNGQVISGIIQAPDLDTARKKLQNQSSYPIMIIRPSSQLRLWLKKIQTTWLTFQLRYTLLNRKELTLFTQELQNYIGSGYEITYSLTQLKGIMNKPAQQYMIEQLIHKLQNGHAFSDALAAFPATFPESYIAAIRGAEYAGTLHEILDKNAQILTWKNKIITQLSVNSIMPLVFIIIMLGMGYFLISFVIPKMMPIISKKGSEIPTMANLLFHAGMAINAHMTSIRSVILGAIASIIVLRQFPKGKLILDHLLLKLPLYQQLYRQYMVLILINNFYLLQTSGLTISTSLKICTQLFPNSRFEQKLTQITNQIEQGSSLSAAFESSRFFPKPLIDQFKNAEQTGKLNEKLDQLNQFYLNEIDISSQKLINYIEPIYFTLMLLYIFAILTGIYLPLFRASVPG